MSSKKPDDEDSGVHRGFYEHSTFGKMRRVQPAAAKKPSPSPAAPAKKKGVLAALKKLVT
jgi:hypothetical protein